MGTKKNLIWTLVSITLGIVGLILLASIPVIGVWVVLAMGGYMGYSIKESIIDSK